MSRRAIELGSYSPNPYMNLALAYKQTGRTSEAKEVLRQGMSLIKPFLDAELLLGEIHLAEGQLDSAITSFEKVISVGRSHRDVAYDLQALTSRGDRYGLDPTAIVAEAHFNLGTVYVQRGEIDPAEAHLRQAISLKPDFTEALANLGILLDHSGRGAEGIPLLERAIGLDPQNAVYHYNLGLAYAKTRQLEAARAEFETSLNLDPSLSDAYQKLLLIDSLLQSGSSLR